MKKRNPIAVFLLPFVTFGIYGIYWQVVTKGEMNNLGAEIPTAWLLIVPIVNIWWLWKYSEGAEKVTQGKLSGVLAFILLFVLGSIGAAVIQDSFNNNVSENPIAAAPVSNSSLGGSVPPAPVEQTPANPA